MALRSEVIILTVQRFGLKTHHSSDDRTVFYDFLTHLHTHSLDFHTSLRQLSSFRPSKTTDQEYVDSYLDSFLSATLARSANSSEKRSAAKRDLAKWLEKYAARVSSEEEKAAWSDTKVHVNGNVNGHGAQGAEALNGNASHEEGSEREEWEERREAAMRGVNPRFVLRQWVLEELIAKLEDSGVDNIVQGRKDLSKILEVGVVSVLIFKSTIGISFSSVSLPPSYCCGDSHMLSPHLDIPLGTSIPQRRPASTSLPFALLCLFSCHSLTY